MTLARAAAMLCSGRLSLQQQQHVVNIFCIFFLFNVVIHHDAGAGRRYALHRPLIAATTTRVTDPDPDWIRIQSGQWIRIRIRNPDPDPGGQK